MLALAGGDAFFESFFSAAALAAAAGRPGRAGREREVDFGWLAEADPRRRVCVPELLGGRRDLVVAGLAADLDELAAPVGLDLELAVHPIRELDRRSARPTTGLPSASTTLPLIMPVWANAAGGQDERRRTERQQRRTAVFLNMCALLDCTSVNHTSAEKSLDGAQILRHRRRRERLEEAPAVAHRPQAGIQHREHAAVGPMPNQPAQPLQQRQNRQRHLVVVERVAAVGG